MSTLAPAAAALIQVQRPSHPRISCVVPAFNEAASLPALLTALTAQLQAMGCPWEVIIVSDGSRDDTPMAVAPWLVDQPVRLIELSRNFGKEIALSAGLDVATGDVVVLMDADLQHPVEFLPVMLQHWREGADMVYGLQNNRERETLIKRWGTFVFYRLLNRVSRFQIPPDAGDFRLLDRKVADALRSLPERNRFMKGLYAWVGFKSVGFEFTPPERFAGMTHFPFKRLFWLAVDGVTSFSNMPLRLWSLSGAFLAMISVLYGLYIFVGWFIWGADVPGWTTLAVGLMLLSGVQLMSVGILGEYIGRVFDEVKQRPLYVVGRQLGQGLPAQAGPGQVGESSRG